MTYEPLPMYSLIEGRMVRDQEGGCWVDTHDLAEREQSQAARIAELEAVNAELQEEKNYNDEDVPLKMTRIAELEAAVNILLHAVCGETGFANAVRQASGFAYPWPALDEAERIARAALAVKP